jgi:hypothetical protein
MEIQSWRASLTKILAILILSIVLLSPILPYKYLPSPVLIACLVEWIVIAAVMAILLGWLAIVLIRSTWKGEKAGGYNIDNIIPLKLLGSEPLARLLLFALCGGILNMAVKHAIFIVRTLFS